MILVPSFGRSSPINGAFIFAKYLHEQGRDVLFVALDGTRNAENGLISEIISSGVYFEDLNIKGWFGCLCYRSRLQDYCHKKGVTIVIAYLLRPTLIASYLKGVFKFAYVRGMLRNDYTISYGKLISKFLITLEAGALKRMDHIFSMTHAMSEWLEAEGINPNRVSIVNNFINVRSMSAHLVPNRLNDRKNINIGMFCSLISRKKIDTGLMAIRMLIYDYKLLNVTLHLAGDGPLYGRLQREVRKLGITDNVVFHGYLANPWHLMQKMNLILLTSASEGMPRCLMEALSFGKTVIASDIPGIRDLIMDRQTGYLYPAGDVVVLALLIKDIIENNGYLPAKKLINFMLNKFDVKVAYESLLNEIEKICISRQTD